MTARAGGPGTVAAVPVPAPRRRGPIAGRRERVAGRVVVSGRRVRNTREGRLALRRDAVVDEGEAQAGGGVARGRRRTPAAQALEKRFPIFVGEAGAVVVDPESGVGTGLPHLMAVVSSTGFGIERSGRRVGLHASSGPRRKRDRGGGACERRPVDFIQVAVEIFRCAGLPRGWAPA